MAAPYRARQTFNVTAVAAAYAPEVIDLNVGSTSLAPSTLLGVTALIESNAATGAVLELWLLKVGGDPTSAGDYSYSGLNITSGSNTWPLASWSGARLRAKSAGNAGAMVVSATAD